MSQGIQERSVGRFDAPEAFLAGLDIDATAALVTAAADVVLVLDGAGVIRDLAFGSEDLLSHGYEQWLGKPWAQTVTVESKAKIEAMLKDAGTQQPSRWRHVNHPSADGSDLPLSYSVVPVQRRSDHKEDSGAMTVAFGRDLRAQAALQQRLVSAQLSMERDHWRLRHVETRYRLLFQMVSEAVLILDASNERLDEANPAAFALLGEGARRPGWSLIEQIEASQREEVRAAFIRLRASGRFEPITVRLMGASADRVSLTASLFRQEQASHLLVCLTRETATAQPASAGRKMLLTVLESAPDALVVTDLNGRVLVANQAFLELAQVASEEQARGESLDRWLGRAGVDLNVLISNLRQRGALRLFATRMRGEYGSEVDVEISAVAVTTGEQPCLGFTVRDVSRRLSSDARSLKELPRSPGQMTELVGRVPLKDIVRETTDLIEQLCIEAALELTGDNRASAAEMLGLSRQSLYVKLRRFGIGDASES